MTRLLLWIIGRATPPANREWVLGDTIEELERLRESLSERGATAWLRREAWRVVREFPRHRLAARRPFAAGDATSSRLTGAFLQDVRFAIRVLKQRRGFTAAAVATLALGIGANVAVFSAVRAVLLDEPPYPDADRIVRLTVEAPRMLPQPLGAEDVEAIQARSHAFDVIGACTWATVWIRGSSDIERAEGPFATQEFFRVFRMMPELGRTFAPEEFSNGARVTILSHRVWQAQFGGAADVIGRSIQIDREPWTIVGVMPASFAPECRGFSTGDVWRPFTPEPGDRHPTLLTFAHLAPGVSVEAAQREIDRLKSANVTVTLGGFGATVARLKARDQQDKRPGLLLLQGVAAFLLLITCANLANLFLTHAGARQHEIGVRTALGAGRWRLVRQLLTEASLIAATGSVVGVALALWIVPNLVLTGPGRLGVIPSNTVLAVEGPELAAGLGLAWLTTLLFGVAPAWIGSKVDVLDALRAGRHATANRVARIFRAGLVTAEVLLAVIVLTGTALLLRSFAHVIALPMGFEPRGLVAAEFWADKPIDDGATRLRNALAARLGSTPMALAASMPFGSALTTNFALATDDPAAAVFKWSEVRYVSQDYFSTLRTSLVRGRLLTDADAALNPQPALVNETFVRRVAGGAEVIGRRLREYAFRSPEPHLVIVGVIADTRGAYLTRAPSEAVYLPLQRSTSLLSVAVRAPMTPALERAIRESAREVGANLAVVSVGTMESAIAEREVKRRFYLGVLVVFGGLAGVLAALGVYGVVSQTVAQRFRELGIRLALGAHPRDIGILIVRGGLGPIALGLTGGIVAAWWTAGLLQNNVELKNQLFQVPAQDPISIAMTAGTLLAAGLLACWIPARRTKRINPVEILRAE